MGEKMSLELSDTLFELRREFEPFEHEARVLTPDNARTLSAVLKELGVMARKLENEVSRQRWNDMALAERSVRLAEGRRIIAESERRGSNIVLFPLGERPFSDGRGGEA